MGNDYLVIRSFRQRVVLQVHRTSHNRHSTFDSFGCRRFFHSSYERPRYISCAKPRLIWTSSGCFLSRFSEGIPVRAKDFSQSWIDGPRILPSMYASPGQREHETEWTHFEHPCRSAMLMERTSWNCGE